MSTPRLCRTCAHSRIDHETTTCTRFPQWVTMRSEEHYCGEWTLRDLQPELDREDPPAIEEVSRRFLASRPDSELPEY